MKTTLDAHRLLRGTPGVSGFKAELQVNPKTDQALKDARRIIRAELRERMHQWHTVVSREVLFGVNMPAPKVPRGNMSPKFRTQGSYAYGTVNEPAYTMQQVDLDDGMFLPVSFISSNGSSHPSLAAKGYFQVVETILQPLCQKHGWKLNPGKLKDTCVRVEISARAHIDIPLYSIPDDEFDRLIEAAAFAKAHVMDSAIDLSELAADVYRSLSSDKIMLANRNGKWTSSDPRKLEDWWDDAVASHSDHLTLVCRYLKAWRDFVWQSGGLPSIAIMACVVKILDDLGVEISSNRDDVALLLVSEKMPEVLQGRIPNPVPEIDANDLDHGWTSEQRRQYVENAWKLHDHIKTAICNNTSKTTCIHSFRLALGTRIPDNQQLINQTTAEAEVLAYSQMAVAAPQVMQRKSG